MQKSSTVDFQMVHHGPVTGVSNIVWKPSTVFSTPCRHSSLVVLLSPWWARQLPVCAPYFLISGAPNHLFVQRNIVGSDLTTAARAPQVSFSIIASVGPCTNKPLKLVISFSRVLPGLIFLSNWRCDAAHKCRFCTSFPFLYN